VSRIEETMSTTTERRPGWFRRHKALTGLVGLFLVLLLLVVGWAAYLNSQIGDVPRIEAGIDPPPADVADEGVNILLAGTDSRRPGELARLVRSGWTPGAMRTDTIMILHVTEDRDAAYFISIPRDTWTAVPGHQAQKINAGFSLGGPELYVDTVEKFTGIHIDHLAVIDWEGFKDLTKAIGGVEVTVPETVTDSSTGKTWQQGPVHLEGALALAYVRQRHGLPNGDFDRIARQQNFIRAVIAKMLSKGTLLNPVRLSKSVNTLTDQVTLDSTFSNSEVRDLALSLRSLRTDDVTFVTVPLEKYARIRGQSAVLADPKVVRELFAAADADELEQHIKGWDGSVLDPPAKVR
jgi:LCP family protein required for cell wall assembly